MQSMQGTLVSHQAVIDRLTKAKTPSREPQPSPSAELAGYQPAPGQQPPNAVI